MNLSPVGLALAIGLGLFTWLSVGPEEAAELTDERRRELEALVRAMVDSQMTASASVAVVRDGRIVFSYAAGLADLEGGVPATCRTRYRIGSTSKMFTALAIMQLVEEGKLSLDDPMARFCPEFPGATEVTLKQLLDHRSGIPNYLDRALADGSAMHPTTPREILTRAATLERLPPGHYAYSNTNYVLLGQIVERVSQLPLQQYLQRHLFERAGMTETSATPEGPLARGYSGQPKGLAQAGEISWYYACGDLFSTAEDLARFDIALIEGKIVKRSTLKEMQDQALPTGQGRERYGLGLQVVPLGDKRAAGHHGGIPGFQSDDELFVSDRFAIVALGNDTDFSTSQFLGPALEIFYPEEMAKARERQAITMKERQREVQPLTERFMTFLTKLLAGPPQELDGSLTETMRAELTPEAIQSLRTALADLGVLENMRFVDEDETEEFKRYHYEARFSQGVRLVTFVLDSQGKLAGLLDR